MVRVKNLPIKRNLDVDEYERPAPKVAKGNLTFNDLPEEVLLEILLKMNLEKLDKLRSNVPRVQQVFENFESLFPPPEDFLGGISMFFKQKKFELDTPELQVRIVRHYFPQGEHFHFMNPSFQWIKKCLKCAKLVRILADKNRPMFLRKGSWQYDNLKKFIHNKCDIRTVKLDCPSSQRVVCNPCPEVMDLFQKGTRFELQLDDDLWERWNFDTILPKISTLTNLQSLYSDDLERILSHKNLEMCILGTFQYFSVMRYVEEWQKQERHITSWSLVFGAGSDVQNGRTVYSTNDGSRRLLMIVSGFPNRRRVVLSRHQ